MFAIKAVSTANIDPSHPWWTGFEFSPVRGHARPFPDRETAAAELGLASSQTYYDVAVVELPDPETDRP